MAPSALQNSSFVAPKRNSLEFRMIFAVSFILSLVMVLALRILPSHWHDKLTENTSHKSIFAEAKASAQTCVSFAFMG